MKLFGCEQSSQQMNYLSFKENHDALQQPRVWGFMIMRGSGPGVRLSDLK